MNTGTTMKCSSPCNGNIHIRNNEVNFCSQCFRDHCIFTYYRSLPIDLQLAILCNESVREERFTRGNVRNIPLGLPTVSQQREYMFLVFPLPARKAISRLLQCVLGDFNFLECFILKVYRVHQTRPGKCWIHQGHSIRYNKRYKGKSKVMLTSKSTF